jgi:FixJ family two-component response regulator
VGSGRGKLGDVPVAQGGLGNDSIKRNLRVPIVSAGEQIPIIFITGHGDIPMTVRAMKAGAAEFLPNPFREQDLLDAIQQALEKDRQAREERAELSTIRDRYETLIGREREVMTLIVPIAGGEPHSQIRASKTICSGRLYPGQAWAR